LARVLQELQDKDALKKNANLSPVVSHQNFLISYHFPIFIQIICVMNHLGEGVELAATFG